MQVLPVTNISQMALLHNRIADTGSKSKRKAVDDIVTQPQSKKKTKEDVQAGKVTTRRSARAITSTNDVTMENP